MTPCHGNASRSAPCLALAVVILLAGCGQRQPDVKPETGREIYTIRCALCHNVNREGIPGMYPPLAGTQWVGGPPERLAAIILDGMRGPSGYFNGVMPGWRGILRDGQIAALMTWLRQADGKPPVTAVEVSHVRLETDGRNTFWTVEDLQNLRVR